MSTQTSAASALGWATFSLIGFAAALSLIVAGQSVGYQHFVPLGALRDHPVSVAVIALQLLSVVLALRSQIAACLRWLRVLLPGWRLPAFAMLMVGSSAIVNRDLGRFAQELFLSSLLQLLSLATVWLAVRALPDTTLSSIRVRVQRVLGEDVPGGDDIAPRIDRFGVVTALVVTVVCVLLSVLVYERHPHVMDEVAYLFQARTFASGRVTLPNPPVPEAFGLYLIDTGPHGWFSPVPPGWAAVLAPGVWLGAPWLVNPVLTGLNVLLAYLVLQPLYGRRLARIATLLLAVSPWNLFLGMSFMAHAVTLCCALAATLGVMAARRTGLARWGWLGGLSLGVIASVRQLDAMIMAAALGLWSIGVGGRRLRVSGTAGLIIGSMIATIPLLLFNRFFTGKPTTFPIMLYSDALFGPGANAYGFGKTRGMGWALDPNPGHGPIDGLINATLNTTATQVELFGWSVGSLILVYVLVLRGRLQQADWAMLGVIAITWLAFFFNYFSGGPDFGGRYWFLMIVPLAALTARGAVAVGNLDLARAHRTPTRDVGAASAPLSHAPLSDAQLRALSGVALLCLGACVVFMPWRAIDKYWHYRGMQPGIRALARTNDFAGALVFISGKDVPDFASASMYGSLDLQDSQPIFARRTTPANDSALIAAFPERPVWLINGPTITKAGYLIEAGPLSAAEAGRRVAIPLPTPAPSTRNP